MELAIREAHHPVVRWIYQEATVGDEVSERMLKLLIKIIHKYYLKLDFCHLFSETFLYFIKSFDKIKKIVLTIS